MTACDKILVCGLGSMGRRRIRIIKRLFPEKIVYGTDIRQDRCDGVREEFGIRAWADYKTAFKAVEPQVLFVCTAPKFHTDYVLHALENNCHTFSEINLAPDGYARIIQTAARKNLTAFLSSTLIYRDETQWIQKQAQNRINLSYRYHVGQYLPDWHPWENYKDFFVGEKQGSACKEILAIELPWLVKAFGKVKRFEVMKTKLSSLELDYEDTFHLLLAHENGVYGSLSIDCVSVRAVRKFEAYSEELYFEWGGTPDSVRQYIREKNKMVTVRLESDVQKENSYADFVIENPYYREIEAFFDSTSRRITGSYTYEKDAYIQELITQLESNGGRGNG